jgi:hypothetical protein
MPTRIASAALFINMNAVWAVPTDLQIPFAKETSPEYQRYIPCDPDCTMQ